MKYLTSIFLLMLGTNAYASTYHGVGELSFSCEAMRAAEGREVTP